jgi:hypothetical protein
MGRFYLGDLKIFRLNLVFRDCNKMCLVKFIYVSKCQRYFCGLPGTLICTALLQNTLPISWSKLFFRVRAPVYALFRSSIADNSHMLRIAFIMLIFCGPINVQTKCPGITKLLTVKWVSFFRVLWRRMFGSCHVHPTLYLTVILEKAEEIKFRFR